MTGTLSRLGVSWESMRFVSCIMPTCTGTIVFVNIVCDEKVATSVLVVGYQLRSVHVFWFEFGLRNR